MNISLPIRLASGITVLMLSAAACSSDDASTTPEQAEEINQIALGMIQQMRSGVAFPDRKSVV